MRHRLRRRRGLPLLPSSVRFSLPCVPSRTARSHTHRRRIPSLLRYLVFLCAVILSAAPILGQSPTTGALGGIVTDPSGAAIPGASLRLQSQADNSSRNAIADAFGEFLLTGLTPGSYTVEIQSPGFDNLRIAPVTVELGNTVRITPRLFIAAQFQTVVVEEADLLPRLDSTLNANLSPTELDALPLDGRRFQGLAILTPLASEDDTAPNTGDAGTDSAGTDSADTDNVRLTVRGRHPMHNSYRLDGLSLTRAFDGEPRGGRALPFTVPLEGVREFQVRVSGATLGHDTGASIDTVTRRGEQTPHGSLFALLRNSGVGASNPFAYVARYNNGNPTTIAVKPRDIRTQFGGSLGGPIPFTRRAFAFLSAEGQQRSFPGIAAPSDPGFFTLTPIQKALLANRGVTTSATATALNFLDGLMGPVDRRADELAAAPRIDLQPTRNSTLTAEWAHLRFRSPSGRHTSPVEPRGRASFGDTVTHADTAILFGTLALTPRWLLDLRSAYSRDAQFATSSPPLSTEPRTGPGGSAPEVSIAGVFLFGNATSSSTRRLPDERRTEAAARLTYSGAAHTIVLGFDLSGIDERISSREASSGAYDYTSGATDGRAGGLVDFITDATFSSTAYPNGGCPSIYAAPHFFCFRSFTQTFGSIPETRFHSALWGAFAGDTWRLTPHLQLTSGVRYSYNRMPPPQHPSAALDTIFGSFAATSTMPSDTNNLAPAAAVAYAPGNRTAIRLDYSIHFGAVPGRTLQAALENTGQPSSITTLRLTPRTLINPACASAGTNFGYPATFTCAPFGPLSASGSATVFARGFQLPMAQIAELSVSQELTRHDTLSATYVLGLDRQLQNTTDLNIAPSTARIAFRIVRNGGEPGAKGSQVFNVPLYSARRTPLFGPVTAIVSNGNGTFHSLNLQMQHRTAHGWYARASWNYSKSLDTVRNPSAQPNQNAQFDPFEQRFDRAPSNFDRRHRLTTATTWQPTLHTSSHAARAFANGWGLSLLAQFSSGRPYSYNIVGGTALTGGRESLNGSGGATYLPSVGPNTQRLPWTQNLDARVLRTIPVHDRLHLRFTAEAFNLLNHVNVTAAQQRAFLPATPGTDGITPLIFQDAATITAEGLTTRAFGTPTSSADSPTRERRLQFGLRLDW